MSDFDKIAKAIRYIREQADQQPTLAEIAGQVNLSEFHFQRMFSRWAGVTPKRFLQALTLERAKTSIRERQRSSLSTSFEIGLSSSSRLYDHFVQLEAVTPSEFRRRGEGLSIAYGCHQTPFGFAFIALTERGVCQLDFMDTADSCGPLSRLKERWPNAEFTVNPTETEPVIKQIFEGNSRQNTPLSLWVRGTNFQVNVWRALLDIQPGDVSSYGELAETLGKPGAARAVGSAVGANPIGLIIPCHRVIRQTGELGGYRWGEIRKQAILAREAAQSEVLA